MIAIAAEIKQVAAGTWSVEESPLRHAPHTLADLVGQWGRSYPRTVGAFPAGVDPDKYWPPVGRIENGARRQEPRLASSLAPCGVPAAVGPQGASASCCL